MEKDTRKRNKTGQKNQEKAKSKKGHKRINENMKKNMEKTTTNYGTNVEKTPKIYNKNNAGIYGRQEKTKQKIKKTAEVIRTNSNNEGKIWEIKRKITAK